MPKIVLFNAETVGVDMKTNPLFLAGKKLHSAVNMAFDEGTIKTRPGFAYGAAIATGCFQGVGEYRPARGISSRAFGESGCSLFVVVDGTIYRDGCPTGPAVFSCNGAIFIYQAESYLIFQSPQTKTYWWNGTELVASPGMNESDWNDPEPQRTFIENTTPVANIPACESITGDEDYLLMFYVIDDETQEALSNVDITVYRNNRVHKRGVTGADGRWSFRTKKRKYVYEVRKPCYDCASCEHGAFGEVVVQGNQEEIVAMTEVCADCDWDITSATVGSNGSLTSLGTVTIANTGEVDLVVSDIGVVCGGSVITPDLPYTVPAGETQVFTVASLDCELLDTALSVTTNCGTLNGVWENPDTPSCALTAIPEQYYNSGASFHVINVGTSSVEITDADITGGANILGSSTGYSIGETPVTLPVALLPAEILYISRMDLFESSSGVFYSVQGMCGGNLLELSGEISIFIDE